MPSPTAPAKLLVRGTHPPAVAAALLMGVAFSAAGCSFLLDFEECATDEDCGEPTVTCVASRCVFVEEEQLIVSGELTSDQTWPSGSAITLEGIVYVLPPATLTIEPGVRILGQPNSALVVASGARLDARGLPDAPIVFTSSRTPGERRPGDWGGLALLGEAPANEREATLESLGDSIHAGFGGNNTQHDCGALQHVRVEFAGFAFERNAELSGLTLAGCGSPTTVDHIQVHFGLGDGVEIAGGDVALSHIAITRAQDDALSWSRGWTGRMQFLAIQQDSVGDKAIDASNQETDPDATPRSSPTLYNVTLLGSGLDTGSQRAIRFTQGTAGELGNGIVTGHSLEAIDVAGDATITQLQADTLTVHNTMFFDVGEDGTHYFPSVEDETEQEPGDGRDDDGGFDEALHFQHPRYNNTFDQDPSIDDATDLANPGWAPSAELPAVGVAPPQGFDESASYPGAFQPGGARWTDGWTAYPED